MKITQCIECGTDIEKKPRGRPALRCEPCKIGHRAIYQTEAKRRSRERAQNASGQENPEHHD